ncbi:MAG: hypothetical protein CVV23_11495 [Ignavibacteriae bacterium HGW-Ignavibacteriae-2]|jgi:hypothetical protein|nr:MAG: hypothetical protein CVV23_11495 [Ignavibacteriae bacterium HGW-Ignavibacteriae-2]
MNILFYFHNWEVQHLKFGKIIFFWVSILFLVLSCRQDLIVFPNEDYPNSIFISSEPSGAEILLEGRKTSLFTPSFLTNLEPGKHLIGLYLFGYADTTVEITVTDSSKNFIKIFLKEE